MKKEELSLQWRTATFWFKCKECVEIVQQFIKAKQTNNWTLRVLVTKKMLDLFAATTHSNCTKNFCSYVQSIEILENKHPRFSCSLSLEITQFDKQTEIGLEFGRICQLSKLWWRDWRVEVEWLQKEWEKMYSMFGQNQCINMLRYKYYACQNYYSYL